MNIQIPEPCHENWDAMNPEGNGRFCGACSKVVADFRNMSNDEILAYIRSKGKEKVCGRFRSSQVTVPVEKKKIRLRTIRFAAAAMMVFGMMLFQSCSDDQMKIAENNTQLSDSKTEKADTIHRAEDTVRKGQRQLPPTEIICAPVDGPEQVYEKMGIVAMPEDYFPNDIKDENK